MYASTSGFGQTGPESRRPAYDIVVQAMGGIMSLTGQPGGPPTRVGTSLGDIAAGLFTAVGIQAALLARRADGQGRQVDVAMLDAQVAILENAIARYAATGVAPGPLGSRHPSITPFEAFSASDGFIVIAVGNDALFEKLCNTIGRSELASDPRFATNEDRTRNQPALKEYLEETFAGDGVEKWLARMRDAGIPCSPVNDVAKVLSDPQVAARKMVVTAEDPDVGAVQMAGNPIKISGYDDPSERAPAPDLDADRSRILAELG